MKEEEFVLPRTYGKTRDCRGCRYWSEKNWKQSGKHSPEALCLNRNSKYAYLYTIGRTYCDQWEDGEWGAIDDPENKGVY